MKSIIDLQRKTAEITDDIGDVLHASDINFQALIAEVQRLHSLPAEFSYLHSLLLSLQALIAERSQLHMGYLITRQIQQEEERVRRERLADYQQKIYDQRRIISDKEGFFESLLRPKKKRLPNQTADEFQEARARDREADERAKTEVLLKELSDIQALKRLIEIQERDSSFNRRKLEEKEKSCSISNVNSTAMSVNQHGEFATEKIIPINDDRLNRDSHCHVRTNSLQHSTVRQSVNPKLGDNQKQQQSKLSALLSQIYIFKAQNEELHHIYDQECLALKFKKVQCAKMQGEYQRISKQLTETRQKLIKVQEEESWRYQRCSRPIKTLPRPNSMGKQR